MNVGDPWLCVNWLDLFRKKKVFTLVTDKQEILLSITISLCTTSTLSRKVMHTLWKFDPCISSNLIKYVSLSLLISELHSVQHSWMSDLERTSCMHFIGVVKYVLAEVISIALGLWVLFTLGTSAASGTSCIVKRNQQCLLCLTWLI